MFEAINALRIRVHDEPSQSMSYIPNVISIGPLEDLFKATEWLAAEALKDYTETHQKTEASRKAHGYSQANLDAIDELGIRIGSRSQGYVNQTCLMEDILIYEYDRMIELLEKASGGKIILSRNDHEPLRERFSSIRTFRNKVVAHTAYTYPKIDRRTGLSVDNPETIVRSILNLFPQEGGVTLGGSFFSGFSQWKSELPVITIFGWEEQVKPIFQDWKDLFLGKILEVYKLCPMENGDFRIEAASPHRVAECTSGN